MRAKPADRRAALRKSVKQTEREALRALGITKWPDSIGGRNCYGSGSKRSWTLCARNHRSKGQPLGASRNCYSESKSVCVRATPKTAIRRVERARRRLRELRARQRASELKSSKVSAAGRDRLRERVAEARARLKRFERLFALLVERVRRYLKLARSKARPRYGKEPFKGKFRALKKSKKSKKV